MINYKPLLEFLIRNDKQLTDLNKELKIHPSVIAKLKKREYISLEIIERICLRYKIPIEQVVEIEFENDD